MEQSSLELDQAPKGELPLGGKLTRLAELGRLPDFVIRFGIRQLCRTRLNQEFLSSPEIQQQRYQQLIESLRHSPIAIETEAANEQHYEIPTEFYLASLGARLKYSCAYYPDKNCTLDEAEEHMLSLYTQRAELEDGQDILELGCGWGSLTLWMAEHFPRSQITAISNSSTQKKFIDQQCKDRQLDNVSVLTADVTNLELHSDQYDRVMSIEMFEHMRNYEHLLNNISQWLKPDGKLFVHIFVHRNLMYPFEVQSQDDWMSKYFFTGGLMPAADTLLHFQKHLNIASRWLVNGNHYAKTCNDWLARMDQNLDSITPHFINCYGAKNARLWIQRWRIFYMACAELFAFNKGNEWMVAHYLFEKNALNSPSNG